LRGRTVSRAASIPALAPGSALANSGVGYFLPAAPLAVVALVPAVLLEAVVLAFILRLSGRRALWISLRANLRSTIVGVVLAIVVDLALVTVRAPSSSPLPGNRPTP
jgi:hypothetical protein